MVTAPEAVALLHLASGFDNRKPDKDNTRAWAAVLADVDFEDAQTAIINHYRTNSDWIMPSDVVAGVRAIESERLAQAPNVYELEPPRSVTDLDGEAFDAAYLAWVQETSRRIRRGLPIDTGTRAPAVDDPGRVKELVATVHVAHKAS